MVVTKILLIYFWSATVLCDIPFDRKLFHVSDELPSDNGTNYRLPNHTHPVKYYIGISSRIDLYNFDFRGVAQIDVVVDEPTRQIVLHASRLQILNITLSKYIENDTVLEPVALLPYTYDVVTNFLTISTDETDLEVGDKLILNIEYSGTMDTNRRGLYRSSYIATPGTERWLAVTHFEPTNARAAFPCYDEPALKARFTIRINHGKQYSAISNMPETRFENEDDTATTSFEETPLTSSYLVAFVISDFQFKTNSNNSNALPQRVYSSPNLIESTTLAVNDGERILNAIENYVYVNFSLPKMDQVAVPSFGPGAMENWGLVLYREELLLWDQAIHEYYRKLNVVTTIAHEFGHQWFGNLVSPKWWTYLWLNEGFANLFQHIGTDLVYPEWKIFDMFVTQNLQGALKIDAYNNTRPMSYYVESPSAIAGLFDQISYAKSGCVLRMFLHAFTEKSFRKGLSYYLRERSFNSADQNDLFNALERAVKEDQTLDKGLNVTSIFSSWSNQKGYPLITVERNFKKNVVILKQERFFSPAVSQNDSSTWWIPFNFATSKKPNFNDTTPSGWMRQLRRNKYIYVPLGEQDWIILNKQQTSYYRVLYDEVNYRLILNQLKSAQYNVIHTLSRSQLLDDLFEFQKLDRIPMELCLDFLGYLKEEIEFAPWETIKPVLIKMDALLGDSNQHNEFRSFVANLTQNFFDSVGIDEDPGDSIAKQHARSIAVELACHFGLKDCLNKTYKKLTEVIQENKELPASTKPLIILQGARSATPEELEALWNKLKSSRDVGLITQAMGYTRHTELLESYLNKTVDDSLSPDYNYPLFKAISRNGHRGIQLCIRLLRERSANVLKSYGLSNMDRITLSIAELVPTQAIYKEFEDLVEFLQTVNLLNKNRAKEGIAIAQSNIGWINRQRRSIEIWLTPTPVIEESKPVNDEKPSSATSYKPIEYLMIIAMLSLLVQLSYN